MASGTQKGISGAVAGAGLGMMVGGPYGALAGGVLGGLTGLMGDDPDITAPSFSDINLAKENPDLFKRLQEQEGFVREARALYDQRRQGATQQEQMQMQDALRAEGRNAALSGIAGGSDAYALANQTAMQQQNNINDRIYKEKLGLFDQIGSAQNNLYNNYRSALSDTMQPRLAAMGIQENNLSNSNQMWSGLASGGLQALGSGYNSYMSQNNPNPYPTNPTANLPAGYGFGTPGQGIQYSPSYGVPQPPPQQPVNHWGMFGRP